ncbi:MULTISPECIES: C39 family peptidase [Bacillus cereus group]|uniref:Peptidase C39 n=1 Tax=Bacillus cereus TaxID=1396 RepID=A0AA44Q8E7_BACCE|nr:MULTISPECIES: C39 family peptidase [Bacillus cereus group]PFA22872.1 peptidase C39 [Bacillus cereus]PFN05595.1 peptidase C39 [Bacillus cereus]PFO80488.1 peptidase C39 [Bacillus cereus]PFR98637.1 peptidase C39 [Bacillus cereus]PGZ13531.1 peptidase C39 [Bacillus cereus]
MKRLLTLYILFSILTGCSAKQPLVKKHESSVGYEDRGLTKNVKQLTSQNKPQQSPAPSSQEKVILDVPLISQKPELKYGCEVTSLAMVLQHAGIKVNKMQLANSIKKDNAPLSMSKNGDITRWGDPKEGFVGDITGKNKGYAVYVQPLQELMEQYLPNRTVNLTGKNFNDVLAQIKIGKPVVVWTTGDYKVPDRWESWKHENKQITAPLDLHAVVLIGFEDGYIYINDPLSGKKAYKVNQETFIQSWDALGKQALSYR